MNDKIQAIDYVSKDEFHRFIGVQRGGSVNMISPDVQVLACIDKTTHMHILNHYEQLEEHYGQPE
jgi:hypothetical protein